MGPYGAHQTTLAADLIEDLRPGMLCLADRLYPNFKLWQRAAATGAALLWRTRANADLPVEEVLSDGSYLSRIYPAGKDKRKKRHGITVRVIEYELVGGDGAEPIYRLITTLLDPREHPARELARRYRERWEAEVTLDEFKTHMRGGRVVLRGKTPGLVEQEFCGMMLAHRAVRCLMNKAAPSAQTSTPTDYLSLIPSGSSEANWQRCQPFPPEAIPHWIDALGEEILDVRVPPRNGRFGPRGVKRKMSGYPIRRSRGPTLRRSPKVLHQKSSK